MGWKSGVSIGFLHKVFYRGHERGMFLTNSSHRKAKRGPLPQPIVSALRILFLVSNNVLQKEKKQILKEMDHFCHGRKKKCLLYIKVQALENTISILLLLFPLQDNQVLVGNCIMRDIIKPAYICKEHWEHWFAVGLRKACFVSAGASPRTQRATSEMQTEHISHSPGSAQAAELSPCALSWPEPKAIREGSWPSGSCL